MSNRDDRSMANRLRDLHRVIAGARKPLILIYGNPDPDALASGWALRELMAARGCAPGWDSRARWGGWRTNS